MCSNPRNGTIVCIQCLLLFVQNVVQLEPGFDALCMAHPNTYVNKIAIGGAGGKVQLWNFVASRLLYTFDIATCAVRCIVSSPALDVVGIGLADGCVSSSSWTCSIPTAFRWY